jgi:hypothetical protein
VISGNTFLGNPVALKIAETQNLRILTNTFDKVGSVAVLSGDTRNLGIGDEVTVLLRSRPTLDVTLPKPLPGGADTKIAPADRRGREAIIVDEWGPYDWRSPKLWPAGRSDANPLTLRVLGPAGEWRVASLRGATVTPTEGRVPGEITVSAASGSTIDWDVRLTYRGASVVTPRGQTVAEGTPYTFGYSRYFVPVDWSVRYYAFENDAAVKDADGFAKVTGDAPVKAEHRDRLDFMSGRAIADGVPADRVAVVADGAVDLPDGRYEIRTISDDGVRVWVDDERVIDRWTPHESAIDTAPLASGRHKLKVEYYELGGFAELRLEILRR